MNNKQVAIVSVASTLGILIILAFIIAIIQTGTVEVIKEELIDEYCSNIPLTDARDLEVCNE
ncbi:MAG TPA: hypothetical protein IAB59_07125 [Candidatus Onthousia faecipullorum]|uniref:Uncharacterized protein n=1 Tax=Candidatus Onthousia faecipullorum TaxID=2840887 RepID=A0A9D1GCA3_9FIRM|nr:hypothetical protein [Candidatus Onthousia faecipullorum]